METLHGGNVDLLSVGRLIGLLTGHGLFIPQDDVTLTVDKDRAVFSWEHVYETTHWGTLLFDEKGFPVLQHRPGSITLRVERVEGVGG